MALGAGSLSLVLACATPAALAAIGRSESPPAAAAASAFQSEQSFAPRVLRLPAVAGVAAQGLTLTATAGQWIGAPARYEYRWQDCDSRGGDCAAIAGAAGSDHALGSADGAHTIRVAVVATNAFGTSVAESPATPVVTYTAPANNTTPVISGPVQQGQALSSTPGSWRGSGIAYSYQWQDCNAGCTAIAAATAAAYTPDAGEVGTTLRVVVSADNSGGCASAVSAQTVAVLIAAPASTAAPVISGTLQLGQTLSATAGTWGNSPAGYAYQWQDCNRSGRACSNIPGATGASYTPAATNFVQTLRVLVRAQNAGGSTSASSAPIGPTVGAISEFSAGLNAGSYPDAIASGADGSLWFTDSGATKAIGRISAAGAISEYTAGLNAGAIPNGGTATAGDGGAWFADRGTTPAIGRITPGGLITEYSAGLNAGSSPYGTASAPDGGLWFTDNGATAAIGRITAAGVITEYSKGLNAGSYPLAIATAPDGDAWFTDYGTTKAIGRITRGGVITEYATPRSAAGSPAYGIAAGADGNLWFTEFGSTPTIGRITPTGAITTFTAGLRPGSAPSWIAPQRDGDLWFGDQGATAALGRITPAGVITEYAAGLNAGAIPNAVAAGPDGNVWFTDHGRLAAVGRVAIGGPLNVGAPSLSGSAAVRQTLSATSGSWAGAPSLSYTYQWQDCDSGGCAKIAGATASSYVPVAADFGSTLVVVVSATNAFGTAAATSAPSAVVGGPPLNTAAPLISGPTKQGQTVTVSTGAWSGYPFPAYSYQWEDCNSAGAGCSDISGATSSRYVPVVTDVAQKLVVDVTATNAIASATVSSAASGLVVGTITEYSAGLNACAVPAKSALGADGNIWFTDWGATKAIGRVTPTGAITEYSAGLNAGASPHGIAAGPDGNLWFTDTGTTKAIGAVNPLTGSITEYSGGLNTGGSPLWIAAGPDGNLWFTDTGTTKAIGRITPAGVITEYSTGLNTGSSPFGITTGSDGNVWFTDQGTTKAIGMITPIGMITEYSTGLNAGSMPNLMDYGPGGNVWFTDQGTTAAIGKITPSGVISEYSSGLNPGAKPNSITTAADGNLWFTDQGTTRAGGQIFPSTGSISEYTAGLDPGAAPAFTTTGPGGNPWLTDDGTTPAIAVVATGGPVVTVTPAVTGTASLGETLTATEGTWTGTPSPSLTEQWQDCDSAGNDCTIVTGANSATHVVAVADVGHALRIAATATNGFGGVTGASVSTAVVTGPPVNTALPVVSGTAQQGQTLSATTGTWTAYPVAAYAYQWQQCDASGGRCAAISMATASSYVPVPGDAGHTLVATVTATNPGAAAVAASTPTAVVLTEAPANVDAPAISGSATQGQTLTASTGAWSHSPTAYSYQWQDCDVNSGACVAIPGAVTSIYVAAATDAGATIAVMVTATNGGGSAAAISAVTSAVLPGAPTNTVLPAIAGIAQQGQTFAASTGNWSGSPTGYGYRWQDCDGAAATCEPIAGATASGYVAAAEDVGQRIAVVVTATNRYGDSVARSPASVIVVPVAPLNAAPPALSGTVRPGETLSTSTGTWSGSPGSYAYQWLDCNGAGAGCEPIPGATSSGYVVSDTDAGHTIAVALAAINAGGAGTAASAPTAVVPIAAPANTAAPVVSGIAQQGQSLSGQSGGWSGSPSDFSYQWEDCTGGGTVCAAIAGATATGYNPVAGNIGDTLRVVVTATNAGGGGTARSAPSAVVTPAEPLGLLPPVISGVMAQGEVLSASHGTWTGSPSQYRYQWSDCDAAGSNCVGIAAAISSNYVAAAGDVGDTIGLRVTATNAGGSTNASSAVGVLVRPAAPSNMELPAISGTAQQGQTLSASPGTWSGPPPAYSYQWQDCTIATSICVTTAGANTSSYAVAAGDVGTAIEVTVTAVNAGGSAAATSSATVAVLVAAPANTLLPAISGTAQQGQTLSASAGLWSDAPTAYAYQWQDCDSTGAGCVAVADATTSSYVVAAADAGATISVVVTATNAGGIGAASSSPSVVVAPAVPVTTAPGAVLGTAVPAVSARELDRFVRY